MRESGRYGVVDSFVALIENCFGRIDREVSTFGLSVVADDSICRKTARKLWSVESCARNHVIGSVVKLASLARFARLLFGNGGVFGAAVFGSDRVFHSLVSSVFLLFELIIVVVFESTSAIID